MRIKICALLTLLILFIGHLQAGEVKILIVYFSAGGTTKQLAQGVEEGVNQVSDATAVLRSVDEVTLEDIQAADGIILGSPTYWGNIASPMKQFIDNTGLFENKIGAAFSTGALTTGGKENVILSLLSALLMKGAIVVGPIYDLGEFKTGSLGVSALTAPPSEGINKYEMEEARTLGKRVAHLAVQLFGEEMGKPLKNEIRQQSEAELEQNSPNPFNPSTTIRYQLQKPSHVTITIFNPLGQKIKVLTDQEQTAGIHKVVWDGTNSRDQKVPSGLYLYQLKVNGTVQTRRMLYIK